MEKPAAESIHGGNYVNMRAALLYGIRDIRLEEIPIPTPGPGEVLLRVASVGVCGSDVHYYVEGRIGHQVVVEPIIMGHEFSTWVAALGPGVKGLQVGQLVAVEPGISCGKCESCLEGHPNLCPDVRFCGTPPVNGVFAEYTIMPAANCYPLPDGFTPEEGALLEPLGVGMHAVDLAHLKPGQTVAVLGAGPIGLCIAAVAKASGAGQIFMTEPLDYRRQFALEYAADIVLNPNEVDVAAEINRLTSGRGVDVAFEAAGHPDTPQQAADMLKPGGKLIVAGIPADDRLAFNASIVRRKGLTIKMVRRMKPIYPRAIRMVSTGKINLKPLVTHHLPLERTEEAMELVANYADGVVKAVVQVCDAA